MKLFTTAVAFAVMGSASLAQENLFGDPKFADMMQDLLIVEYMDNSCDGVSIQPSSALSVQEDVDRMVRDAGYEPDEARAILELPEFADPLREAVANRLADMGVQADDPETLCAVAREKTGRGGLIGKLLVRE